MRRTVRAGLRLLACLAACNAPPRDALEFSVPYEVDALDPHARDRTAPALPSGRVAPRRALAGEVGT